MNSITTKFSFLSILILALNCKTYCVDTVSIKYCPLSVGNIYKYAMYVSGQPTTYTVTRITKDTVITGRKYFYCSTHPVTGWCRTDSNTGSLYKYDSSGYCQLYYYESLVDSLAMRSGSYFECNSNTLNDCEGETNITLFGIPTTTLTFSNTIGPYYITWSYAKNFGYYHYHFQYGTSLSNTYLVGCVINGVAYGDTTFVGMLSATSGLPEKYSLYQNYPNPFNPVTIIKFQIPWRSNVSVKVYDMLGILISELVNKRLDPGEYETAFNGVNLSSGVYFYRIEANPIGGQAGEFVQSKKMVLVK